MSKKSTSRTMRRVTGASLSGALAAGMMLAAAPVQAADDVVDVTAGEIRGDETTYAGWHQGYSDAELAFGLTKDGLSMAGKSQVIRGYADNNNAELATDGVNADLDDVLVGASYGVKAGAARFQVPLFVDLDDDAATPGDFTTLRPDASATGDTTVAADDLWVSSKALGTVAANAPTPLSEILTVIGAHKSKTIGFGVLTVPGEAATISSINWDSKKYVFKADAVTTTTVADADIADEETSSNYTKWHQGYADATARHQVTDEGLVLAGKSQVIKGFTNNSPSLNAINANLQFALLDASYTVAAGSDDVFFQIPLRSENIAGNQFATLRNTGAGAGTNTFSLNDNWQSSKAIGSIDANTDAKLGDIIAALGNYKVIGFGVLTNSGDSATVSNVTFDGKSFDFADAPVAAPSETVNVAEGDIAANEDVYEGWHQGAVGGERVAVDSGELQLGAAKSQAIKGYANNTQTLDTRNIDLGQALTGAAYTVADGTVHFQVPMFVEDPITGTTKFTTLRPAAPASTGNNTFSIGQEWVSSKAVGSIDANTPVLLADILSVFKTYKVIAFGVYSDTDGNGKVSDITWDDTKYTFLNADPEAAELAASTRVNTPVDVTLTGTDAEGDALTYSAVDSENGTVAVAGNVLTYTPADDFAGTDTVTYTVNDGRTKGNATGEVEITVKANGAPVVTNQVKDTRAGDQEILIVELGAVDPEDDAVTFEVAPAAHGSAVMFGGALLYQADADFVGVETLVVTATDEFGAVGTGTVTINVEEKANNAPKVKYTTGTTNAGQKVIIKLDATDPDGDNLTYTAPEKSDSDGKVTVDGDELTYTPVKGFGGIDNVVVTVTDGNGGEAKFLVRIKVNAVRPSMSLKLSPKAPTSKSNITATVKIVVPGSVVAKGANVYIFDGNKRIGAAKMDADGTISIKVSKLKKGTHKVTARFYGTKSVARTDRVRTLKIKK